MKNSTNKVGAVLAGIGSAFALFPTGQLDHFVNKPSIASRMNGNFAAVGGNLKRAMGRAADEQQQKSSKSSKSG